MNPIITIAQLEDAERLAIAHLRRVRVDLALARATRYESTVRARASRAQPRPNRPKGGKHAPWCNAARDHVGDCQARPR